MKKILAIILAAVMLFSCSAMAETVRFVEGSSDFDITVEISEGVQYTLFESVGGIPMAHFQKGDGANVFVTIQASEQYDGNLKDLPEEDQEALIADLSMDFNEDVEISTQITPKGNMYVHFHSDDNTNVETLWTLYAGYSITLTLFPDADQPVTEEDHEFMMQLFYDLDIVPVAK